MRRIPIEYAREGDILGRTLYNNFGGMLLRGGTKLTNRIIIKLKKYGYYSIYIKDKYTEREVEEIIKPEIMTRIHTLQEELQGIIAASNYGKKIDAKDVNKNIRDINEIVNEIVYETIFNKDTLYNLHNISIYDDYTLTHSINMMLLSIVLANDSGFNMDEIKKLAIGCIFHDIGKTFIPIEIINKPGSFTDEEYELVKSHSEKGYEFLTNYTDLHAVSRNISLSHHEREDGLGYPRGLRGDEIHKFSKVAAICDVFDALTSDRPYRRALPLHDAMEYILASGGNQFSIDLIRTFSNSINIYSKDTLVLLSDGREGIVYEVNHGFNTRPKIKIYGEEGREVTPYVVDLMSLNNIVIEKTLHIFSFDMYSKIND
ncbi:MAG: HD-GYP domain-containing protein [Tissierella sp.]|nr:HD-GYP domain-containing protein [Tissierella sp.]